MRTLLTATGYELPEVLASSHAQPATVCVADEHGSGTESRSVAPRIVNGEQTDDFPAVGIVNGYCTGTLISPTHVLTAAHCVEGVGSTQGTFEVNGQTYSTARIFSHPQYNPNDFGAGYDIAIMELSHPVNGVQPMNILRTPPQVGQMLTLVGFGEGGTSSGGYDPNDDGKQVGRTELEEVTDTHIAWNFDSHNEANTAPGDSGGPAFVTIGAQFYIAGVTSGGTGNAQSLGDYSFDTRVDVFASWIDGIVGIANPNPTPGPDPDPDPDPGPNPDPTPVDDHADLPGIAATLMVFDANGNSSDSGELEQAGDRDVFQIDLTVPGAAAISATSPDGSVDTYLRIYDQLGQLLGQNDDHGGTLNSQLTLNLDAGTYFASVASYADSGQGDYRIDVSFQGDEPWNPPAPTPDPSPALGVFSSEQIVEISPSAPNEVTSSIEVANMAGPITDLNVSVEIQHTWVGDLRLTLMSPGGTQVRLVNRVGSSGDDFAGTTFDDEAGQPIQQAAAPFQGTFRPAADLSAFDGEHANGSWTLVVSDRAYWDGGRLNGWSLNIETDAPPPSPTPDPHPDDLDANQIGPGATALEINDGYGIIAAGLEYDGDVDVFQIDIAQSGFVSLGAFAREAGLDLSIELFDERGNLIASGEDYAGATFVDRYLQSGLYYVAVASADGVSTGDYDLDVVTEDSFFFSSVPPASQWTAWDDAFADDDWMY